MNYIHNHDDYAVEPVRGLPAALPRGEFVLWQGAPAWQVFARQVFHTRLIALLVVLAAIIRMGTTTYQGGNLGIAAGEAGVILAFGFVGLSILWLMAWLVQKTTVYTITNKRIVMRIGVAIQKTFNVPFAVIDAAALRTHGADSNGEGNGTISVSLKPGVSLAYLVLWPHARPWKMGHTQPSLRAIPDAGRVARLLQDAFTSHAQAGAVLKPASAQAHTASSLASQDNLAETQNPADTSAKAAHYIPGRQVLMVAMLAIATVFFVGIWQWAGIGDAPRGQGELTFEQAITFDALPGDRIAVINADTGQTITTIERGTDGLLRSALRGLNRSRSLSSLDLATPYVLQRYSVDGLYMTDALTDRSIRLQSFGPVDSGALADLLALGL